MEQGGEGQGVAGNTLSARNAGKSMGKNARGGRKEGDGRSGEGEGKTSWQLHALRRVRSRS